MSVVNLFSNSHEIKWMGFLIWFSQFLYDSKLVQIMIVLLDCTGRSLWVLCNNLSFSVVGQVKESHILPDTWSKAALYHSSPNSHVWIFMQSQWHSEKMFIIANAFYHAVQKCHRQSSDSLHCIDSLIIQEAECNVCQISCPTSF